MEYVKVFEEIGKEKAVFTVKEGQRGEGEIIKELTSLANVEDIDMVTSAIYTWLRMHGYEPVFHINEFEDWSDGVIDYWQSAGETIEQFQARCK